MNLKVIATSSEKPALGINGGAGRIAKLALWRAVEQGIASRIVVNFGREVGETHEHAMNSLLRDSTYGEAQRFLFGNAAQGKISGFDESAGTFVFNGVPVQMLFDKDGRNPINLNWLERRVPLVIDATDPFSDHLAPAESPNGSLRGHLAAGARKVLRSSPFKSKITGSNLKDFTTFVMGINEDVYDPAKHNLVSVASCTTTGLSHMIKPLLDRFGNRILNLSMVTIHAATNTQSILDSAPAAGSVDRRKNRASLDDLVITTTGATKELAKLLKSLANIGFLGESVRVPTTTGSAIILDVTVQKTPHEALDKRVFNQTIKDAAAFNPLYMQYTEEQLVSRDVVGQPIATLFQGYDTHTREAEITVDLSATHPSVGIVRVPVVSAKLHGYYDNEWGFTAMMTRAAQFMIENDI